MNSLKNARKNKKAVLYTRVSTDEQAIKGYSLIDQEDVLKRACMADGVEIVKHFRDDGYSAKTFNRPAFQQMLGLLKAKKLKFDYLYVVRWDRFSRNITNSYIMIKELMSLGVEVICLEETLDHSDPASVLIRAIKLAEPEMDNRRRSINSRMGMRRALKEGRYACGRAPLGYSWDRNKTKSTIVPNSLAHLVKEAFEMYSTGLYAIEYVRKAMNAKGLKIGKTAFNQLLRRPIYAGKIKIPEYGDEEEQIVDGVHEAIIDEELFTQTQNIFAQVLAKNSSRINKKKENPQIPLRGFLKCPKCGNIWTGSGSRGNGGIYYYYHCQNGCKERIRADYANDEFIKYLKTFKVYPEVAELYLAVMEDIFKTREGDREAQLAKIERSIREANERILKIDEMFVSGDLEKDSYYRLKKSTQSKEAALKEQYTQLKLADTNFMRYCRYGTSLLENLDMFYKEAPLNIQKKLIGSIFTEKLVFEDGSYRTTKLNKAVELIGLFQKELGNKKLKHLDTSSKTFGKMPRIGLEPTCLSTPDPKSGVSANF
ncbi:MAG: recombinase family protein, partial [Candidatus Thorarchaeota archaeon]